MPVYGLHIPTHPPPILWLTFGPINYLREGFFGFLGVLQSFASESQHLHWPLPATHPFLCTLDGILQVNAPLPPQNSPFARLKIEVRFFLKSHKTQTGQDMEITQRNSRNGYH